MKTLKIHEFVTAGIDSPELPPFRSWPFHPLRSHLMFMDDHPGNARLACSYLEILRGSGIPMPYEDSLWNPPVFVPIRTTLTLLPDKGLVRHNWVPDGSGLNTVQNNLRLGDTVLWNGEPLEFSLDADVYEPRWPEQTGIQAKVVGPMNGDLTLTPRHFSFKRMLSQVDQSWLFETSLESSWGACVWDWQKIAVLWHALARLEPRDRPEDRPSTATPGTQPPPSPPNPPPLDLSEALQQPDDVGDDLLYYLDTTQPLAPPIE